ncbi:hypothetical protein [Pseudoalteromonas marina]|uniref:hypothetical protein n=1 Tax=Pseudoalteromonas marina TaxID=267375 RepID=UPI0035C83FEA
MSLNPYQEALVTLITESQNKYDLSHLEGEVGEATWDDAAWKHKCSKGKATVCYFRVFDGSPTRFKGKKNPSVLADRHRHLLMVYALEQVIPAKAVTETKVNKMVSARKLLSTLAPTQAIATIDNTFLRNLTQKYPSQEDRSRFSIFIDWLQIKKLINPYISLPKVSYETSTGEEQLEKREKYIPEDKLMMALGAIFHDAVPTERKLWDTHALVNQRDAFTCAASSLCMAAPNRMLAEIPVLDSQLLKTYSGKFDGELKTVHYLNWKGSKGFKNNNNHILSVMAPAVERALKYMQKVTEVNRALARFYTNPKAKLKEVLGSFKPSKANWGYIKPSLDKPTNLLVLGTLLGFYDDLDCKKVAVEKGTDGATERLDNWSDKKRFLGHYEKEISELTGDNILGIGNKFFPKLFGYNNNPYKPVFSSPTLSLSEMQRQWIIHVTEAHPDFPVIHHRTAKGKVDARTALFAFNGYQMRDPKARSKGFKGAASFYSLVPVSSLDNTLGINLSGPIFERHGFSSDFKLNTHGLRHLLTDTGDKQGIPHEILNLWGGRKTPEQLLHYVYQTDGEKADLISDILFNTEKVSVEDAAKSVRVVSLEKYREQVDNVASKTSSGVCVQNLMITPCSYFNDFETQCALCSKSCHVAHDEEAIKLLESDIKYQRERVAQVTYQADRGLSQAKKDWYKIHCTNIEVLSQLVDIMKDSNVKKGSFIRLVTKHNEFRITDLDTKKVERKVLSLPDVESELDKLLTSEKDKKQTNETLNYLLEMI